MRCLEVTLSYDCDVDCVFCSHAQIMKAFSKRPIAFKEIQILLARKRREDFSHVSFVGGEPSLHSDFARILAVSKRLGYRTRVVSNGAGFSMDYDVPSVLTYLDELCLSIHGGTSEAHDKITRSPGSFERIMGALHRIDSSPAPVQLMVNMVATKLNVESLTALAASLSGLNKIKELWLSDLVPIGNGLKNYDDLALEHRLILERIPAIVRAASPVPIRFYGLPFCMLGGLHLQATALGRNPSLSVFRAVDREGRAFLREMESSLADPPRVITGKCVNCVYQESCGGPWARYHEKFGASELRTLQ